MKSRSAVLSLMVFTSAILAAQTNAPSADSETSISRARCQYVEDACRIEMVKTDQVANLAPAPQFPRPMPDSGHPRPPVRRPMRYPRTYPRAGYWTSEISPRHAAIGAIIGFGLGALAGSRSSAADAFRAGGILGGMGSLIGLLTPEHRYYPPPYGGDDDEDASRSTHGRPTSASHTDTAAPDDATVTPMRP